MAKGKRNEKVIDRKAAIEFQQERRRVGDVIAWNITQDQQRFIARPRCTVPWGAAVRLEAPTLDDLRNKLPPGLCHFPGDEAVVEVWI